MKEIFQLSKKLGSVEFFIFPHLGESSVPGATLSFTSFSSPSFFLLIVSIFFSYHVPVSILLGTLDRSLNILIGEVEYFFIR